MYVVTGAAGFLGSGMVAKLNAMGRTDVLVVDDLGCGTKWKNLLGLSFTDVMGKAEFLERVKARGKGLPALTAVIHMGACSSTTQFDAGYLLDNNFHYTKTLAGFCLEHGVRFVTASSAATYGDGAQGFDDDPARLPLLRPLNPYGFSKHLFDLWAAREGLLPRLASLKFFNVFGPGEEHKGDQRSMVSKAVAQIRDQGSLSLFKSHRPDYANGEQARDFVWLFDCLDVMAWLLEFPRVNGVFNVGCGRAATWNELAGHIFSALGRPSSITYVDMPENIRGAYQYHTQAPMGRLRAAGYTRPFTPLGDAVTSYVQDYLVPGTSYVGSRPL